MRWITFFLSSVNWLLSNGLFFAFSSGYGKTVSHVVIGLKTAKGTKQLKVSTLQLCVQFYRNNF